MTAVDYLLPILFVITLFLNIRASFKLGLDWRGMLTTVRFVREAYARLAGLPGEDALEREVAVLRAETGRLTAEVDRLRSDPEYIEQMARERLGLVKPGDRVYKLPPTPGPAGPSDAPGQASPRQGSQ